MTEQEEQIKNLTELIDSLTSRNLKMVSSNYALKEMLWKQCQSNNLHKDVREWYDCERKRREE